GERGYEPRDHKLEVIELRPDGVQENQRAAPRTDPQVAQARSVVEGRILDFPGRGPCSGVVAVRSRSPAVVPTLHPHMQPPVSCSNGGALACSPDALRARQTMQDLPWPRNRFAQGRNTPAGGSRTLATLGTTER